jgi:hypothetical protein
MTRSRIRNSIIMETRILSGVSNIIMNPGMIIVEASLRTLWVERI